MLWRNRVVAVYPEAQREFVPGLHRQDDPGETSESHLILKLFWTGKLQRLWKHG